MVRDASDPCSCVLWSWRDPGRGVPPGEPHPTAIMGRICRRGNAGPHSERKVPQRNTCGSHSGLRIVTKRELDVALGVIGPTAGFQGVGVESAPRQDRRKWYAAMHSGPKSAWLRITNGDHDGVVPLRSCNLAILDYKRRSWWSCATTILKSSGIRTTGGDLVRTAIVILRSGGTWLQKAITRLVAVRWAPRDRRATRAPAEHARREPRTCLEPRSQTLPACLSIWIACSTRRRCMAR